MRSTAIRLGLCTVLLAFTAACDEQPPPIEQPARPIRTFTVTEVASGQVRRFSAVIEASDSSSLSFQITGNVQKVAVNQGDQVTAGQVLAVLDQEPFKLSVQAAQADLQTTRANLAQAKAEYERQKTLYEQGWVARARFDNAERDYRATLSRVDYAVARLSLAERDLRNTTLTAPFDGFISLRTVDAFVEVRAGQELFRIDAEGGLDAAFGVPETTIAQIILGMPASVKLPQFAEAVEALVTEVGSAAGAGNTFPVNAALIEPPAGMRPGMSAEVTVTLADEAGETGYLVPLSAVTPGEAPEQGFVFVYDPASGTVRRTPVKPTVTLASNMVAVTGVAAGDIVATAGANFLVDGQAVELMTPPAGGGSPG